VPCEDAELRRVLDVVQRVAYDLSRAEQHARELYGIVERLGQPPTNHDEVLRALDDAAMYAGRSIRDDLIPAITALAGRIPVTLQLTLPRDDVRLFEQLLRSAVGGRDGRPAEVVNRVLQTIKSTMNARKGDDG